MNRLPKVATLISIGAVAAAAAAPAAPASRPDPCGTGGSPVPTGANTDLQAADHNGNGYVCVYDNGFRDDHVYKKK